MSLQVSSGGAEEEGISGSGEVESDSSMQVEGGEERREVGSSSQYSGEVVGTSGEAAASSGVTTSTQEEEEEALDSEQDEGEEDVEVSEDMEEGEVADELEPDNLEDDESETEQGQEVEIEIDDVAAVTSEEEGEVGGEEEAVAATVEDNSSEPSSSTGARHARAQGFGAGQGSHQSHQYGELEAGEDSVVPSTPKLPIARRTDGFAEAVSSPQVIYCCGYFAHALYQLLLFGPKETPTSPFSYPTNLPTLYS